MQLIYENKGLFFTKESERLLKSIGTIATPGAQVKVGDYVPGKRLNKSWAQVVAIHPNCVQLCYNGDVRDHKLQFHVIDAELRPES